MATTNQRMQQRGGLYADLIAANETPLEREIVVAFDTGRVWIGDGITPLASLTPIGTITRNEDTGIVTLPDPDGSQVATVDSTTYQLPDIVRAAIAANLADPTTPEGAAVAAAGGGGGAGLTYDSTTGLYSVSDSSSLTYDPTTGLYSA
jgi:hypothetical protein